MASKKKNCKRQRNPCQLLHNVGKVASQKNRKSLYKNMAVS